jgi:hypothetical protein
VLFQNHPAFAEIRPGMGYAPGARNFGYAPGARNFGDVAHMGYAAGARGMGNISQSMKNVAVDATPPIAPSDIELLDELGATDQDISDIVNGNATVSQVYAKYGVTIPSSSTATAAAQPSSAPQGPTASQAFGSAGQLPTGSEFSYIGGWSPIHGSVTDVQSALSTKLPSYGMQLVGFTSTGSSLLGVGTAGFNAIIAVTGVGFALLGDAQSIVVSIVQSVIGSGNLSTNQISLISTPSTPAGMTPSLATNPLSWLEDNALYIGLGIGALVLLNNFTGRKRR